MPRSSVNADLPNSPAAPAQLAARARKKLDAGRPLEAMHLLDIALGAEPTNADALRVKKDALQKLLAESGGSNLSETMWLKVRDRRRGRRAGAGLGFSGD